MDLFEENKGELSTVVESIDAAGRDDDTFCIEIRTFGSVYWIEAVEFDSIGYFESSVRAVVYALMNYEPFIAALREREEREP